MIYIQGQRKVSSLPRQIRAFDPKGGIVGSVLDGIRKPNVGFVIFALK